MSKKTPESITFRTIENNKSDLKFLYAVYASTRAEELAPTGWSAEEIDDFLRMQFNLQHEQYIENYPSARFEIILLDNTPVGRLYVNRMEKDIRVMDIALLPNYRQRGIAAKIFTDLIAEADRDGRTLSLHVEMNNPILAYYTRLGFVVKADVGVYHFMERRPVERYIEPELDPH